MRTHNLNRNLSIIIIHTQPYKNTLYDTWSYRTLYCYTSQQWRNEGEFGVFKPRPKFRSFDKAEPNFQFRGKYIRNNLTRIRLSLIFWVVSWKTLPASYDLHSGIFFSLQGMTWRKHKVPKIKKMLPYEMKFLVLNYSCLQNPWLGGYRAQIHVLSVLCPQLNLKNPHPPKKNSWVRHWSNLLSSNYYSFCVFLYRMSRSLLRATINSTVIEACCQEASLLCLQLLQHRTHHPHLHTPTMTSHTCKSVLWQTKSTVRLVVN